MSGLYLEIFVQNWIVSNQGLKRKETNFSWKNLRLKCAVETQENLDQGKIGFKNSSYIPLHFADEETERSLAYSNTTKSS